jgi:hypothetical protein
METEEFVLLAYHKFLLRESRKDRITLAGMILADAMEQSPAAFDLLSETGDEKYTDETFLKAADLLIKADDK